MADPGTIGIVGGTGPQGKGLGLRLARAGHVVRVGSRDAARAEAAAGEIAERAGQPASVTGHENSDAAAGAAIVVLAVPYEGHGQLVRSLAPALSGKVVISCVNPLGFGRGGAHGLSVPDGSAAQEAAVLVPDARVVGAFHHLSAVNLWSGGDVSHEDVLVCGDDDGAKREVMDLAVAVVGHAGIDAGSLQVAYQLESLTAVLINVNKRYRTRSGIALVGVPRDEQLTREDK